MVWYVPPLSPVISLMEADGYEADPDDVFPAIDMMRIPLEYLANLLSAGDAAVVREVLRRLAAMRAYMRKREVLKVDDLEVARAVDMDPRQLEDMYRLLAIAKYEDRYIIPQAHTELARELSEMPGACSLDHVGGPGGPPGTSPSSRAFNEKFMVLRAVDKRRSERDVT
jgi:nitrate reductase / nitrite oxidoreductase, beta subunit